MKYYIKVEKDVKILVEDINFDLGNPLSDPQSALRLSQGQADLSVL